MNELNLRNEESQKAPHEEGRTVTILSAVKDRHDNLRKSLPSWLRSDASEIVLVDFGNLQPLDEWIDENDFTNSRLRTIRVPNEPRWVLTWAFNWGLSEVAGGYTLKLDADYVLRQMPATPDEGSFLTGSHHTRDSSQVYLNGLLFAKTRHLKLIGGWDERITTYGWDDSDLYNRLKALGLRQETLAEGQVLHLDHSNIARVGPDFPQAFTPWRASYVNQVMTDEALPWKGPVGLSLSGHENKGISTGVEDLSDRPVRGIELALKKKPKVAVKNQDRIGQLRKKSLNLLIRSSGRSKRVLVVLPQGRLPERLQILAAGYAASAVYQRELVLAWVPDELCNARARDLFYWEGELIETKEAFEDFCQSIGAGYKLFPSAKRKHLGTLDLAGPGSLIFQNTFCPGNEVASNRFMANRFLQSLVLSDAVRDHLVFDPPDWTLGIYSGAEGAPGRPPDHSRSPEVAPAIAPGKFPNSSSLTEQLINAGKLLDAFHRNGSLPDFYVAARDELDLRKFAAAFPGRVKGTIIPASLGSLHSAQVELAALTNLSRSKVILAGAGSLFAEMAWRLSKKGTPLIRAGIDF